MQTIAKTLCGIFLGILLLSPASGNAATAPRKKAVKCLSGKATSARVDRVLPNADLLLANGQTVRLIGIRTIKLLKTSNAPLSGSSRNNNTGNNNTRNNTPIVEKLNRLARKTVHLLRQAIENRHIALYLSGQEKDRYDRLLAQIIGPDGKWLQGILLQEGLARAVSYKNNRACMKEMLALEKTARRNSRGLWRYRLFRPLEAQDISRLMRRQYRFTLVEGVVRKVAMIRKWAFLNFGENWRTDFTIAIKRKYLGSMNRNGLALPKLAGKRIRVRGWIERWNGPLIKVTHKEQIEILQTPPPAKTRNASALTR